MKRYLRTEIGILEISADGNALTSIKGTEECGEDDSSPILIQAENEIKEYFSGERTSFSVAAKAAGTAFQKSVWEALRKIPYGETRSYSDIAILSGHPNAVRAVANAVGANPIPIIIPCHRVIHRDGSLGGFSMYGGIETKIKLLRIEGISLPE